MCYFKNIPEERFLNFSTTDIGGWIILCYEGQPVHCRVFSVIYYITVLLHRTLPRTHIRTHTQSRDIQKCHQTSPNAHWERGAETPLIEKSLP